MFKLLLPTTCFSNSFDHHQLEKIQVQKGKMLNKRHFFLPDDGQTNDQNMQ
jgi:hypothetical protein